MNNPAQLKYLEAMGIPVWVSRDKVIEQQVSNQGLNVDDQQHEIKDQNLNLQQSTFSNQSNHVVGNSNKSSAKSIIESLNYSNSDKVKRPEIKEIVKDSLEKTNIDDASINTNVEITHDSNLLHKSAEHYIFACGNKKSDWMVIGHSPEPFTGIGLEPFANESGVLLDNMIRAVGINNPRQQAYYLNVVNIQHSNTSLKDSSDQDLFKLLNEQIKVVQPQIIIIVGQIAAQNLLEINEPLINMRSKIHKITNKQIPCVVTYYPSYLLEKPLDKRKAWNDLKLAMSAVTDVS